MREKSRVAQISVTQLLQHSSRGSRSPAEKLTCSSGGVRCSYQRYGWHMGTVRRYHQVEWQLPFVARRVNGAIAAQAA